MSSCPASLLPLACQPVAMSDAEHFYEDDSCGDEEEEEEEDEEDGLQFSSDEVRNRCLLWGGMMVYFFSMGAGQSTDWTARTNCMYFWALQEGKTGDSAVRPGPTYQTLSADTISKKMFDIVDEVNVVFQLPTPYVRLLLIACKWDKEKLLERYGWLHCLVNFRFFPIKVSSRMCAEYKVVLYTLSWHHALH